MAKPTTPHKNAEHYDRLLATHPEIERQGAAMPYTSMNGNMFSFLSTEGIMALRLSREDRLEFLKKYATNIYESKGAVMHEYVTVPPALLKHTHELEPYFKRSIDYARTLKPRETPRPVKIEAKKAEDKKEIRKIIEAQKMAAQKPERNVEVKNPVAPKKKVAPKPPVKVKATPAKVKEVTPKAKPVKKVTKKKAAPKKAAKKKVTPKKPTKKALKKSMAKKAVKKKVVKKKK